MEHTLSTQIHDAKIELSMGLYTVRFADEAVLDVNQNEARRDGQKAIG